jgi:hypothetical protein
VPYQPLLDLVKSKLKDKPFRVQVKCQTCSTTSILSRPLLEKPKPGADGVGAVQLLPPTPGDEALIDTAKGISGVEALKAATANATFVTANIALIGTVVTALGLAKTEEIASRLTGGPAAIGLLLALFFGAAAILFALWALRVRVRDARLANLEEVRATVNGDVRSRARASKLSITFLAFAILSLAGGFGYIAYKEWDEGEPKGTLTVSPTGTLNIPIETSWSGAEGAAELQLEVRGAATLDARKDTSKGSAEIKTSVQAERGKTLTITSRLKGDDVPSSALKQLCYSIPNGGAPQPQPCPSG